MVYSIVETRMHAYTPTRATKQPHAHASPELNHQQQGQGTFNDDFHVFGLYWDENQIYTYLDTDDNRVLEVGGLACLHLHPSVVGSTPNSLLVARALLRRAYLHTHTKPQPTPHTSPFP